MQEQFTRKEYEAAADAVRERTDHAPRIGIVLGSGLRDFAGTVEDADVIPYGEIPHWPVGSVEGHGGDLYIGTLEGQTVMVMSGRSHFYEGMPLTQITLPMRVMQLLGVEILILTNAAGAIDKRYHAGDLMLITDHINVPGMAGHNPLRGPNDESLGPRFPDMVQVYDSKLRGLAAAVAAENDIPLHEGIYAMVSGPSFETPAEIRLLRTVGATAVGMSTAPEAVVARHGGLRVLGISGISNVTTDQPTDTAQTTHEEVLDSGKVVVPRLETVLRGVLQRIPDST